MPKLLVIRRNRLGDAVSVLPWLQGLKMAHQNLKIDVLTNPYASPVFERSAVVHNVFSLPEKYLGTPLGVLLHPLLRQLRHSEPYDFIVSASYSFSEKASLLAYLIPGREKIGVVSARGKLIDRAWTIPVHQTPDVQAQHQVQRIATIGRLAGLSAETLPSARLKSNINKTNRVALCPDVNRHQSRWSEERWLQLEDKLLILGMDLVWLGQKPMLAKSDHVETRSTSDFFDAVSSCSMVVCSEGGVSHIAPAFDIPTIVLSGMEIQGTWIPWSKRVVLLERNDVNSFTALDVIEQVQSWNQIGAFKSNDSAHINHLIL